tara:strand:+ start:351 stop:533 length:183 start_codon:yes stop_codon:yes gene_type:complete
MKKFTLELTHAELRTLLNFHSGNKSELINDERYKGSPLDSLHSKLYTSETHKIWKETNND